MKEFERYIQNRKCEMCGAEVNNLYLNKCGEIKFMTCGRCNRIVNLAKGIKCLIEQCTPKQREDILDVLKLIIKDEEDELYQERAEV